MPGSDDQIICDHVKRAEGLLRAIVLIQERLCLQGRIEEES